MKRRTFLTGCCAAISAMGGSRLGGLVFAQPGSSAPQRDIIINVFLRGGMDALSFLPPHSDSNYHIAQARLGLRTEQVIDLDGQFGLHPSLAPLRELMQANHLAIIAASGSPNPTRSHFEAQDYMDRGIPADSGAGQGGWLSRYLSTVSTDAIFAGVSMGSGVAVSLEGFANALSLSSANGFTLSGSGSHMDDLRRSLRTMYAADPQLATVAQRTLDATDIVDYAAPGTYVPTPGITYPNTDLARTFANLAQMIKMDLGLQAATIDFGGWDTHESQVDSGNAATGRFAQLSAELAGALHTFWSDMASHHNRLVIVVMSEFGRRLRENDNRGTDHGHGGIMMVLSGHVTQGRVWGQWPGLATDQLFENVDLQVTTDFRTVLAEIMQSRLGISSLSPYLPGFTYPGALGFLPAPPAPAPGPSGLILH